MGERGGKGEGDTCSHTAGEQHVARDTHNNSSHLTLFLVRVSECNHLYLPLLPSSPGAGHHCGLSVIGCGVV